MTSPVTPGDRIGRWRLESVLGEGGMARVYAAADDAGARVALKLMIGELGNPGLIERFEQEARLLTRVRHPHLVQVLEAGRAGGAPWMAMELVEGRPIGALIKERGGLQLEIAVPLLAQLADALAALHAAGVVHRDVKPGNVMVSDEGWVTLLDLGIARTTESALTRTGMAFGTPGYMAPEQILGDRNIGPPADVYAFAVLAWRMLTGAAPFQGKGEELLLAHVQGKRPCLGELRPELPAALTPLFERALAVEPAARFPNLGVLWETLEAALESTGHVRTQRHQLERLESTTAGTQQQLTPIGSTASTAQALEPVSSRHRAPVVSTASPQTLEPLTSQQRAASGPTAIKAQALDPVSSQPRAPVVATASTAQALDPARPRTTLEQRGVMTSPQPTLQQLAPVAERRPQFDDSTAPAVKAVAPPVDELEPVDTSSTRASLKAIDDREIRSWARAARVLSIIAALSVLLVIAAFLFSSAARPPAPQPVAIPGARVTPTPPAEPEAPEADPAILARLEQASKQSAVSAPASRTGYSRSKVREYAPRSVRKVALTARGQPMLEVIALVGGLKVKAEVDVDGVRAGTTPVTVPFGRGRHSVRVEAPPNPPSRFDISGGGSMRLEVELVPLGAEDRAKVATPF